MKKKIKSLDEVREYLRTVPRINQGGCGVAALAMARWLEKNDPLASYGFIMCYDKRDDERFATNSSIFAGNNIQLPPVAPSHVGLVYKTLQDELPTTLTVDTANYLDPLMFKFTHTFHRESLLVKAINNVKSWNPKFKRALRVKKIAKVLDIDLSDIDITPPYPTTKIVIKP